MRALNAFMVVLLACVCIASIGCGDGAATPADAALDGTVDGASDASVDTGSTLWFEDVAAEAGVTFSRALVDDYQSIADRIGGGVCVIDVDGAAPLDLFFPARRGQASALFVGRGVFDYVDEAEARGLAEVGDALGCVAFDAEGDGDTDLVVTGLGTLALFENEGGSFTERALSLNPPVDPRDVYTSAAAGDVDGDGDLDLLVAGYVRFDPADLPLDCDPIPCGADPLALPPIASRLLLRDGSAYTDATDASAPALLEAAPTFVVSIFDVDGDGSPELLEWNDLGATHHNRPLQRDADGVFRDAGATLGLDVTRRGTGGDTMGWSAGDIDGDGRFDHVTSDYHGAATAAFFCGEAGCFDEAPRVRTTATAMSFRWGLALVDVDLDGDLDLFEAAGHLATEAESVARGFDHLWAQPPNLLRWTGAYFEPTRPGGSDGLAAPRVGRGLAIADLDDDGRPDVIESTAEGPVAVLRNRRPPTGHYLRVRLEGAGANRDAIGAELRVTSAGVDYRRRRSAGEGFLSSGDPRLHVGLPSDAPVDVEVRFWPSGARVELTDVAVDAEVVVRE